MWSFSFLLFWGCCGFYSWVIFTLSPLESMAQSGNECTDTTMCPAYATCTNTSDSYYCSCKRGFLSTNGQMQFKDPTVECLDIDECSQSPPVCGPHSICKNLPGRYRCSCLTGFSSPTGNNWILGKKGRFICTDVNECANPKTCPEHAICRNSVGSYSCVCKPGFESSRGKTSVQGPGQMCRDIDECSQSPPACGPHSVCRNLPGSYKCSCLPGFSSPTGDDWIPAKGGRFACVDINECLQSGVCPEHSQCTNSLGSYSCSCHVGFTSTNSICEDVDECANPRACPEHASCRNSVGSYSCVCKSGFESSTGKMGIQGPGETCRDIDECSQSPPACGPHSVCRNLPGSYKCSCLPGFSSPTGDDWIPAKGGRFACVDINECLQSGVCPEHSQCTNSLGSYSCSCHVGFTSTNSICEDVDECANPRACPEHASCRNSVGSYSCVCKSGFESSTGKMGIQGPGETCRDIDECSQSPPACGPHSVCRNLPGSYKCSCLPGFSSPTGDDWIPAKGGRFACVDINECLQSGVCPEHSQCTNSLGSYSCSCHVGFTSTNSICEDIDECSQSPPACGPHSVCRNLPGSYKCSCLPGFSSPTGDDWIPAKGGRFACVDINECLQSGVCPEHSQCTNSLGSYSCSCHVGFTSTNSICEDVDECANPRACPEHASCRNSVGSYSCVCKSGFESSTGKMGIQGPGETCRDIDECSQSPPACGPHSVCRNLPGSYKCSCLPGFSSPTGDDWIPAKGGRFACVDINECLQSGVCPEHSQCTNSLGSYSCSCHVGFTSTNSICEDVDECANPRACPEHASCRNSVGSYSCVCKSGFESSTGKMGIQGPGETCRDIDECSQSPPACGPHSVCRNLPGSYKCSCLPGFSSPTGDDWIPAKGGRFACVDINECLQSGVCPEHSQCTNSLGSYSCSCHVGFTSTNSICEDVDECANPRACPEHASCRNSVGSYSCVCKSGFESSTGKMGIQGPGETCRDIDECSQSPPACGPHSVCRNLPGSYKCSCLPGFSSPTGDDWIPAKGGRFACVDINECLQSGVCPEHSQCTNSLGSYSCSCHVGFTSTNSICEDVDECANPRACPEHASCRNSVGSYSCVCKSGFESSTGKMGIQGPGETCRDIDECSQSPPACGPHSVCRNLPGSYKCSCLPGFSSPTGDDWIPAKGGRFACVDINECLQSGVCPEHSQCTNSLGSYSCSCHVGFTSTNSICEDVDECANPRACPEHASCRNSVGSYSCVCKSGFESSTGKMGIQGPGETCRDVDECSSNSTLCGPSSVCTNLPGKYSCSCLPGFFSPGVWSPEKPEAFKCTGVPFKCKEDVMPNNEWVQLCQDGAAVKPKYVSFCAVMNATFSVLDDACKKTTAVSLKNTAERFASVIEKTFTRSSFTKEEISTLATVLLKSVESTTLASFLKPSANVSQTIQTEYLGVHTFLGQKPNSGPTFWVSSCEFSLSDIESKVINKGCTEEDETFNLKAKGDKMKIWCSTIKESESTGISGVAFVSFEHMESVLDERFFQDPQTPWANSKRKLKMNSRIVSGIITGEKKEGFSKPVIYTLENIQPKQNFESPICVSWNTDGKGGRWTPSGCVTLEASETHTVCSCNQMVNLAVIMASGELTMEFALFVISHVGTIFSLVCLAVAIITFLLCRTIRNHNTYIHLHLCVCLFLANLLFLTGADKTHHQIGCAIIAGFLHYLFLACFFWMLVEAVMLFLMVRNLKVVNYFSSHNIKMLHLCAFGYGLPGLVVFVAANIHPQGYGMYNRCWLNTEKGFIWSFLGPVCTIIVVNSILLTWTLGILRQKLSSLNDEVSTLKDTRLLTFKAFAQIFILGCSWVLGIFQIGPIAGIMAYLFTVINSLQGAFIFLIHCLLNRQVREAYSRCITGKTKPGSQTSGISLSSVPSASKTG
ncbi:adhesion G protein-coupled receptor E1 isoform X6 [Sus scrofa]|uniref:adhesion G protein-coupled receptor E1 isoform X6 n=1 Tax=Sus scrofa TaxID=9823 RepID=UPI000A2B587F|nr:adhesion G protein-coupled receptor E1 isoform X6 [Sus scrofa]